MSYTASDLMGLGMNAELASLLASRIPEVSSIAFAAAGGSLVVNTLASADNARITIGGGGTATSGRGAFLSVAGNQFTSPGFAELFSGNVAGSKIRFRGTNSASTIDMRSGGDLLRWSFLANGDLAQDATNGGNLVFNKAASSITGPTSLAFAANVGAISEVNSIAFTGTLPAVSGLNSIAFGGATPTLTALSVVSFAATGGAVLVNTVDDTDNAALDLSGAGAAITARGGFLRLYGNENAANGGGADFFLGNMSTAIFRVRGSNASSQIQFRHGGDTAARVTFAANGDISMSATLGGNLVLNNVASGLQLRNSTNGRIGTTGVMVAGVVTISNTSITANTVILHSRKTTGGTTGAVSYTIVAGTSFTLTSNSATETSTFDYVLMEKI